MAYLRVYYARNTEVGRTHPDPTNAHNTEVGRTHPYPTNDTSLAKMYINSAIKRVELGVAVVSSSTEGSGWIIDVG